MRGPWKRRSERWWLAEILNEEQRAAYEALTREQQARYWRAVREGLKR